MDQTIDQIVTTSELIAGWRRLTPGAVVGSGYASAFNGLPQGVTHPAKLLGAFKAAAPWLDIPRRLVDAMDWLFKTTRPQDWSPDSRPIVWPSAETQQEELGLKSSQVKRLNRALVEAGLVVMKDSPNGKRYGRRDKAERITDAFGFDLSPLAVRYQEFLDLAARGRSERETRKRLRHRVTVARRTIAAELDLAGREGLASDQALNLEAVAAESARLTASAREARDSLSGLARIVEEIEQAQAGIEAWLRQRLGSVDNSAVEQVVQGAEAVDMNPKPPKNGPHIDITTEKLNRLCDTVIACEESSSAGSSAGASRTKEQPSAGFRMPSTAEVLRLSPRLRDFTGSAAPSWPEMIDAADWLRQQMGISKSLWGEACIAMGGRAQAALGIAIVAALDPEHFVKDAASYFCGMVKRAKTGELHLDRSWFGLRQRDNPRPKACAAERNRKVA